MQVIFTMMACKIGFVTGFQTEGIPRVNIIGGGEIDHIIVNDSGGNLK